MTEIPPDDTNAEQLLRILLAREHARADAWFRRDRRALDALLAPNYHEINTFGSFSREDILVRILPLLTLHSFTIEDPKVTGSGTDSAVITYRCTQDSTLGNVRKAGTYPVSAHYELSGKLWKISRWEILGEEKK